MAIADVDVLIIGAGISGIGAAYHLRKQRPASTYAILEARGDLGGTWDLFRYPGIRSDSDLFTFGYDFKPWESDKSIAEGPAIQAYLRETARENGIEPHIRYHHKVLDASWSSSEAQWSARVKRTDTGEETVLRCRWLFLAAGYYRYDEGFTPPFRDRERFRGRIVHPQHWPADLDYRDKRVVVIGSGATAVTLLPALADLAAHVVMLQRTPTYVLPVPTEDPVAKRLRPFLGRRLTHLITRRKNIAMQKWIYQLCQKFPKQVRRLIRHINARMLPENYPVDIHFNPPYEPWTQRLCAVPSGDLFRVIRQGRASVVTDRITAFTETGILLESGNHLEADLIITATGLNLQPFGGLTLVVDGEPIRWPATVAFKGLMLSSVPNFAFALGYTSSSWTLKVGLLCEYLVRLLDYMDSHGHDVCTPVADPGMETQPLLNFGAGYVQRSLSELPRQGKAFPWVTGWNYASDVKLFRKGAVTDKHLRFTARAEAAGAERPAQVVTA